MPRNIQTAQHFSESHGHTWGCSGSPRMRPAVPEIDAGSAAWKATSPLHSLPGPCFILNRVAGGPEEVTLEQRQAGNKRMKHVGVWGKTE